MLLGLKNVRARCSLYCGKPLKKTGFSFMHKGCLQYGAGDVLHFNVSDRTIM